MYPYVRCFCGRPIGALFDLFKKMRQDAIGEYMTEHNIDAKPDMLPLCEDIQVSMAPIFVSLRVDTQCCKARLLTQSEFIEYY